MCSDVEYHGHVICCLLFVCLFVDVDGRDVAGDSSAAHEVSE